MPQKHATVAVAVVIGCLCVFGVAQPAVGQEDIADVPHKDLRAGGNARMRYFLIGRTAEDEAPKDGLGLLLVLPGGDGGPDFLPFVKRIWKRALPKGYLIAELVSVKWTPQQRTVWPTQTNTVDGQKFSTEQFIDTVITDVKKTHKLNEKRILTLGWSSSGPALYAASLRETRPFVGSFIAMSVFKPNQLPPLKHAARHAYFIYHSPDDRVCPLRMARSAQQKLAANGATVKFVTYSGGHGWRGNVFGDIRKGIGWLGNPVRGAKRKPSAQGVPQSLPLRDGFETGKGLPTGWAQGPRVPGVRLTVDKQVAFEGTASVRLEKTAKKFWPIAQWFRTVQHTSTGKQLEVSVYVKASLATKATVDVQFRDANGESLGHKWAIYVGAKEANDPPANHDWKQYTGAVDIPPGTQQFRIAMQMCGPGTVWFDDLRVSYVGTKPGEPPKDSTQADAVVQPKSDLVKKAGSDLKLARMYLGIDKKDRAREVLQKIIEKYPDTEAASQAKKELENLE